MAVISSILMACGEGNNSAENNDDSTSATSSDTSTNIIEETVDINADTTVMQCFAVFDENKKGTLPIVLVLPEWWGLNDFPKNKARQLAQMGYLALAVDIYGRNTQAPEPQSALQNATKFYANPQLATARIKAALDKAKTYPQADTSKTAAIGFCFGGSMVLNAAKLGLPLDGVVSFHGGLAGVPPTKGMQSKILVCHGAADSFVPEKDINTFRKQLDEAGVSYNFKSYPDAKHAFTNPEATENGEKFKIDVAYNESAAKNAWSDMQTFFADLW
jgi:dienelactone hydrolase